MNQRNRRNPLVLATLFAATLASFPQCARAQATSGDLVGTVLDATGAAVPNATVEATNMETNSKAATHTDASGGYRIGNLLVGRYNITATAAGFSPATIGNVDIQLNKTQTTNLTLQIGQVTQTVEVQESGATIDTTTAQVQNTFDSREATDLPSASYSSGFISAGVLNLSMLNAGVASNSTGYGVGPSIGGQRPTNNSFNVEGIDNNDKGITGPIVYVPTDAVAQLSILQNQFQPEFGFASGGIFNTVVKSGTNQLHGSLYEYFQNRNLNAVDQQTVRQGFTSNPRSDSNRLGATIGGPILKNRLFYFGDFEYNPVGQAPTPPNVVLAPTAGGYTTLAGISGVSKTNLQVLQKFLPAAPTATDSTPVGLNPNVPGSKSVDIPIGPISVIGPSFSNQYNLVAGGDWNISNADNFRVRYIYNKLDQIDPAANLPIFWGSVPNHVHLASMSEFHNFSATSTNELRLSFSRRFNNYTIPNFTFPGLDTFPNIQIENDLSVQLGPNPNTPSGYIQNIYQGADNYTKVAGRHTIKAGYDFHDIIASNTFVQRARGDYDYFTLNQYILDLAPDHLGQRSVGAAGGIPVGYLQHGAFVSDDFRLRSNLTLNLGVRYEYLTTPIASRAQALNAPASVPGLITFAAPKSTNNDWSPRVGIAYSPGTSGKTSIRAGFGTAFDQFYNNLAVNEKPPYYQTTRDVNVTSNAPGFLAGGGLSPAVPPLSTDPATLRQNTASYTFDQIRPYSINWNLSVQHVFHDDYTAEIRYVGTRGVHLWVQEQLNRVSDVTPTNSLPTFLQTPTAAQLAGLHLTLNDLKAVPSNAWAVNGFPATITSYAPIGDSTYHGLQMQLKRRFTKNLSFSGSYTWSHAIDDATATVFSTVLTPRRGQDFRNLSADRSSSLLDRRHRFTLTSIYDAKWFSGSNWLLKNIVGNWTWCGTYTYESPELATVQSGVDSNLNNDALDRSIINTAGIDKTGSGVNPLNAAGQIVAAGDPSIVAYVAKNPNARYIQAGLGAYPNAGRNTLPIDPINNIDASLTKRFHITERMRFELSGQFYNLLNHSQFIPGFLSDVTSQNFTGEGRNYLIPSNKDFGKYQLYFPSNSRQAQIVARFVF